MSTIDDFVKNNYKWLLAMIFFAGGIYSEFQKLSTVEERLTKKIKVIEVLQEDIRTLQIEVAILKAKDES